MSALERLADAAYALALAAVIVVALGHGPRVRHACRVALAWARGWALCERCGARHRPVPLSGVGPRFVCSKCRGPLGALSAEVRRA